MLEKCFCFNVLLTIKYIIFKSFSQIYHALKDIKYLFHRLLETSTELITLYFLKSLLFCNVILYEVGDHSIFFYTRRQCSLIS